MTLLVDPPSLDVLLDRALQTGGETGGFDFKESLDFQSNGEHKIRLLKAIGSFGNTDNGGHIIIGVSDDRRVVGITPELAETYDQTPVQRMVGECFAPPPVIQVRQHERDGKKLVIIEVLPFRDFPSVVKKFAESGKEKLREGTFLVRNAAAESAVLTSEAEVRKLCDAIAIRRARSIVELIQRGTVGLSATAPQPTASPPFETLTAIRQHADNFWPSAAGSLPYLETCFAPDRGMGLRGTTLKEIFPASAIRVQNGFPFHAVSTGQVEAPQAWGWLGIIPFYEEPNAEHPPSYLWLLERSGAFLYRNQFWEDGSRDYKGTVGIFHVIGKLILTLRFLDRVARRVEVPETTVFRVGVVLNLVKGRYITNEKMGFPDEYVSTAEGRVEAFRDAPLGAIRGAREDFAVNLLEEVVWQFRRQDWSRQDLLGMLRSAPRYMGGEYAFPEHET